MKPGNERNHHPSAWRLRTWEPDVPQDKDVLYLSQMQARSWVAAIQLVGAESQHKLELFVILSSGFALIQVQLEVSSLHLVSRNGK